MASNVQEHDWLITMYPRCIRVLLVEDSPSDVWLVKEALRLAQLPAQIDVARDGVEATTYLRRTQLEDTRWPDLVLLDLNLPRKNGREVLAEIKRSAHPALQNVPVIVLSSSNAEDDRHQVRQLDANEFRTKPNSLPAYVEMVQSFEKYWQSGVELRQTA
jgi:chemotaxis family two-component system response regulator Rcp1